MLIHRAPPWPTLFSPSLMTTQACASVLIRIRIEDLMALSNDRIKIINHWLPTNSRSINQKTDCNFLIIRVNQSWKSRGHYCGSIGAAYQ